VQLARQVHSKDAQAAIHSQSCDCMHRT